MATDPDESRENHVCWLYAFLTTWTVVQFTMCVLQFLRLDSFELPAEMPVAYAMLVFIYVLRKEVDRWMRKSWKRRRGEYFFIGWWLALLVMFMIEFWTVKRYDVPHKMVETCMLILLPYAATALSKMIHQRYMNHTKM